MACEGVGVKINPPSTGLRNITAGHPLRSTINLLVRNSIFLVENAYTVFLLSQGIWFFHMYFSFSVCDSLPSITPQTP